MSLLDTDRVLELLRDGTFEFGDISIITVLEVLRGLEPAKRTQTKKLLEEAFIVHGLDNDIVETYSDLYRRLRHKGESLPDADLLIAATAIARDMTLKTRDEHFERLKALGLKIAT